MYDLDAGHATRQLQRKFSFIHFTTSKTLHKMEVFWFGGPIFESLYNCSRINISQVLFVERQHFGLGAMYLSVALTCELLYIPCMFAIWKRRQAACYKIMLFIGVIDMMVLLQNGILTGILAFMGAVYCTFPTLIYVAGNWGNSLWATETTASMILALNRCVEIGAPKLAERLFRGNRVLLYLLFPVGYGLYWCWTMRPHVFSSVYVAWFFNPYIGYAGDPDNVYSSTLHDVHNYCVFGVTSTIYSVFCLALCAKRSGNMSQQNHSQRIVFLQVFLITTVNSMCALLYVYMQFVQVSELMIVIGQLSWILTHGIPPLIYLSLNKTIRMDCTAMIAQSLRLSSSVNQTTTQKQVGGQVKVNGWTQPQMALERV